MLKLKRTGTLGLLLDARKAGLIERVGPVILALRDRGARFTRSAARPPKRIAS
ncbi:DUF3368 domain-containing protein [Candidatus Sumerlaeota bacterium]|nr:DUF3368 domain-containing protein [Candidatus Sumerlaeota bacterium]